MCSETEKKDTIEKLIDEWFMLTLEWSQFNPDWTEKKIKDALRTKAYEFYGITP